MGTRTDLATVMVTVKTYPSPSDRYGETVCVAGVRLDRAHPEWIRLYPMRYRQVDYEQQFTKYSIIEIPVTPHGSRDPRLESMRPSQTHLHTVEVIDTRRNWAARRQHLGPLIGATTTCELIAANSAVDYSRPAPSLGLVRVRDVTISVQDGEPWTSQQLNKAVHAAQPDLFNLEGLRLLEPAPFTVHVRYRCEFAACLGHEPRMLDWEAGQAGRKWLRERGPVAARKMLQEKYESLFADEIDAHLYVGNMHQHRHSFSALGVWSAKKEAPPSYEGTLFDV